MAGFRGLYDKLVSYIFDTSRDDGYSPVETDYVAVYDSEAPRNTSNTATWMPKKYVPVTTIGTGGGGGGTMSSFDAQGSGVVQVSLDGSTFEEGPLTVTNGNTLYVQAVSVPSGLTWQGTYDLANTYASNDVVSTNYDGVYSTWWAQTTVPANEFPPIGSTSNAYWVQLGTQGPIGPAGPPGWSATSAFRTSTINTSVQASGSSIGTNNDTGVFVLMDSTTPKTFNIPLNLNSGAGGFWLNSQVSIMNINTGTVQITKDAGVTLLSADNATYLRTQYSAATLIRKDNNVWYLFGDLTNIV